MDALTTESNPDPKSNEEVSQGAGFWRKRLSIEVCREREEKVGLVLNALKSFGNKHPSLVLITGPTGSGKSHLIQRLRSHISQKDEYFIRGAFNEIGNKAPYSAFVDAFTEFTSFVIDRGQEEIDLVKSMVAENLETCGPSLTEMIPALKWLVHSDDKTYAQEEGRRAKPGQRFLRVLRMFVKSLLSAERRLFLCLDDLEYADVSSLELIVKIAAGTAFESLTGIVIIVTYDPSHEKDNEGLSTIFREVEGKMGEHFKRFDVENLDEAIYSRIVTKTLGDGCSDHVVQCIFRRTAVSLLSLFQCIEWLLELGYATETLNSLWINADEIDLIFENISTSKEFITKRLDNLPMEDREFLKNAACLGSTLDSRVLNALWGERYMDSISRLVDKGILSCREGGWGFEFVNPIVHRACYELVPLEVVAAFHLALGRRIWQRFGPTLRDEHLFSMLIQYASGASAISLPKERVAVSSQCIVAGQRAAQTGAFLIASLYLQFGIELLGQEGWVDEYELTLMLHNAAAEMEMCNAKYERMNDLLEAIFANTSCFQDKVQAFATKIYQLGVVGKHFEAIDTGLHVLSKLGERFPTRQVRLHLLAEVCQLKRLLRNKSDAQLMRLPEIQLADKLAALRILQLIFLNTMIARPSFVPFIQVRMLMITLRHGLSVFAAHAFALYGMVHLGTTGDIETALRFGELALALLDKFGAVEYVPRVHAVYYGIMYAWKYPISNCLGPLLKANAVGLETGDFEYAALCGSLYCFNAMNGDVSLSEIVDKWAMFSQRLTSRRQEAMLNLALPVVELVHRYRGLCSDPVASQGVLLNYTEFTGGEGMDGLTRFQLKGTRLILYYVFNEYELAYKFRMTRKEMRMVPPGFIRIELHFFTGMLFAAIGRDGKYRRQKAKLIRNAKRCVRALKRLAGFCPENSLHKLNLLEAEIASTEGKARDAFTKYYCAIALSEKSGIYVRGLAYECTGRHFLKLGDFSKAQTYLLKARTTFAEWGAEGKAAHLEAELIRSNNER